MSADRWSKFFWSDYDADEGLRVCSLAAQGLWMRMLCIMARATPKGDLRIGGEPCTANDLARTVGESESTVEKLLEELHRRGVSSVAKNGVVFSRRLRKDEIISRKRAESGRKGGLASLGKQTETDVCSSKTKASGQADIQAPEARSQIPEEEASASSARAGEIDIANLTQLVAKIAGTAMPDPLKQFDKHSAQLTLVQGWLTAGADEALILDVVTKRSAASQTSPRSLRWFDDAVREAVTARAAGQSKMSADTDWLVTSILERKKREAAG